MGNRKNILKTQILARVAKAKMEKKAEDAKKD